MENSVQKHGDRILQHYARWLHLSLPMFKIANWLQLSFELMDRVKENLENWNP